MNLCGEREDELLGVLFYFCCVCCSVSGGASGAFVQCKWLVYQHGGMEQIDLSEGLGNMT